MGLAQRDKLLTQNVGEHLLVPGPCHGLARIAALVIDRIGRRRIIHAQRGFARLVRAVEEIIQYEIRGLHRVQVSMMASIWVISSDVMRQAVTAFAFALTCVALVAPQMTVETTS